MNLSKYSVIVRDYPVSGQNLIYHTRTQALVKIEADLMKLLDRVKDVRRDDVRGFEDNMDTLFRMGIIVKDEADDQERFERFIEQRKYAIDRSHYLVSILTTYNCNFACTYCFEESTRTSSQKMGQPTADQVMEWVKKKVERYQVKGLTLNFYGGEPLLNQHIMEYIGTRMKSWCEERGKWFEINIQTNGALMTPEFLDQFVPMGLTAARISLDGTKEVHDRQRPMRGTGKGTFDGIIENVKHAVDRIKVSIAMTYDEGDASGVVKLLDYLDEINVLKKLENFVHTPVHPTLGPKDNPSNFQGMSCMGNYDTEKLIGSTETIKNALRKKGYGAKSGLSVSMCPVTREHGGVTIDTNGLIFKCNSMLGHPDLSVGSVREDEFNALNRSFMASDAWKQCGSDCPYAPICNTGCRLFGYFKQKDWMAKSCERSYMDEFVPMAVKKEYQIRLAAKSTPASAKV